MEKAGPVVAAVAVAVLVVVRLLFFALGRALFLFPSSCSWHGLDGPTASR